MVSHSSNCPKGEAFHSSSQAAGKASVARGRPFVFDSQRLDFQPQCFVLSNFLRQEPAGQFRLCCDAGWREQIEVGELVIAVSVILGLDKAFRDQSAQAVVRLAQAHTERCR